MDETDIMVADPDTDSTESLGSLNFSISEGSEPLSDYATARSSDFDIGEEASDAGSEDSSFDFVCDSDSESDVDISDWSSDENVEEISLSGDVDIADQSCMNAKMCSPPLYIKGRSLQYLMASYSFCSLLWGRRNW